MVGGIVADVRSALAGVTLMLGLNVAATAAPTASWSDERTIVSAEAARKSWTWLYRSGATPWTPALDDVLALEKALPDYLGRELTRQRSAPTKKSPLSERAKTYKRQYVGVRSKGRRAVFANFFCNAWRHDWRTEPVVVHDGGDCYFTVEYDVEKGTFSNLMINGEA